MSRLIRTSYGCVQMPSWLKRGSSLPRRSRDVQRTRIGRPAFKEKLEKAARLVAVTNCHQQPLWARCALGDRAMGDLDGAPADAGMGQGAAVAMQGSGGAGQGGRSKRGRGGARTSGLADAAATIPRLWRGDEMQPAGRRQRTPGSKVKRGRNGEVNGNVAPGYQPVRSGAGQSWQ